MKVKLLCRRGHAPFAFPASAGLVFRRDLAQRMLRCLLCRTNGAKWCLTGVLTLVGRLRGHPAFNLALQSTPRAAAAFLALCASLPFCTCAPATLQPASWRLTPADRLRTCSSASIGTQTTPTCSSCHCRGDCRCPLALHAVQQNARPLTALTRPSIFNSSSQRHRRRSPRQATGLVECGVAADAVLDGSGLGRTWWRSSSSSTMFKQKRLLFAPIFQIKASQCFTKYRWRSAAAAGAGGDSSGVQIVATQVRLATDGQPSFVGWPPPLLPLLHGACPAAASICIATSFSP